MFTRKPKHECSFSIHDHPRLAIAQMSFDRWTYGGQYISRIPLSLKITMGTHSNSGGLANASCWLEDGLKGYTLVILLLKRPVIETESRGQAPGLGGWTGLLSWRARSRGISVYSNPSVDWFWLRFHSTNLYICYNSQNCPSTLIHFTVGEFKK